MSKCCLEREDVHSAADGMGGVGMQSAGVCSADMGGMGMQSAGMPGMMSGMGMHTAGVPGMMSGMGMPIGVQHQQQQQQHMHRDGENSDDDLQGLFSEVVCVTTCI